MKSRFIALMVSAILAASPALAARTAAEYVAEARKLADAGSLADALVLLEQGAKEHPKSSDIQAYMGLYKGMSAGRAQDYMEAGRLSSESFVHLDKAVELGPENPRAYLYRGIMGVKFPPFLGRLSGGIADLKHLVSMGEKSKDALPPEMLVTAYSTLGEGYEKAGDAAAARAAYETVMKLAPGTDAAKGAKERIEALAAPAAPEKPAAPGKPAAPATPIAPWSPGAPSATTLQAKPAALAPKPGDPAEIAALKRRIEAEPGNAAIYRDLARAFIQERRFEEARAVLYRHNEIDPSNAEAYRLLTWAIGGMAEKGYDARIVEDTDFRTGLAFEAMNAADKAVQLDPKNIELRITRGMLGIMMPFFVGKHDQGVADLEYVLKHTTSPADSAQALYYLGVAREREAMRYWVKVATKFPDTDAAKMALAGMRPVVGRFDPSKHEKPAVEIDFVLGFRDELAPQVAVWIEDAAGEHVKTVFVSGFAGNVKGKQVTLPVWAEISKFAGADAVTGASIDVGHHVYVWDCKDLEGRPVKPGRYAAKVEVSHWPSMRYQLAEATFGVGKKGESVRVEEGDYVPSLVVTYYPK